MKVTMLKSVSGPTFAHAKGSTTDVNETEATRWIKLGIAAPVRTKKKETTSKKPLVEKAVK